MGKIYKRNLSEMLKGLKVAVLCFSLLTFPTTGILAGEGHSGEVKAKGVIVVNPAKHEIPETIDQVIVSIQSNFHNEVEEEGVMDEFLNGLKLSVTTKGEKKEKAAPFSAKYLGEYKNYFMEASSYLASNHDIEKMAMALYSQWIYLEMYKVRRWEFLMIGYAKILVQDETLTADQSVERFKSFIPESALAHSPYLKDQYDLLLTKLKGAYEKDRRSAREYMRGLTESNYLALSAIKHKKSLAKKRFNKKDVKLKRELEKLEKRAAMVENSALLLTSAFRKDVAPYMMKEALPTKLKIEKATNVYLNKLSAYLETKATVTDVKGHLSAIGMVELNKNYITTLEEESAKRFRARIAKAYPKGVAELRENMEKVIEEHKEVIVDFDLRGNVVKSNTSSNEDMTKYYSWLVNVFKEQQIHYLITTQFPYLVNGVAEALTGMAALELKNRSSDRYKNIFSATALVSLIPLGRIGNKYSSWMGSQILRFWRYASIGLTSLLVGKMSYLSYKEFLESQRIGRLARTNVEGVGLTTMIQAEGAYKSFLWSGAITGLVGAFAGVSMRGFRKALPTKAQHKTGVKSAIKRTWNGYPNGGGDVARRKFAVHLKATRRLVREGRLKEAGMRAMALGHYSAALSAQFLSMPFAAMSGLPRKILSSIPSQIYSSVMLFSVVTIMSALVSYYITAWGVQAFSDAFRKLGIEPPAFWQLNELDSDYRLRRQALAEYAMELSYSRVMIALMSKIIFDSKRELKTRKDLSERDRTELITLAKEAQESIDNNLESNLLQWYKVVETRTIRSSFFKEKGFGVLAEPNMQNPVRLTIFMQKVPGYNDFVVSHSVSVAHLENVHHRRVEPDLGIGKKKLKALAERLKKLKGKVGRELDEALEQLDNLAEE